MLRPEMSVDNGDMSLLAAATVMEVFESLGGLEGHGDPSFPQELAAGIGSVAAAAVDHVVQCVFAEIFVHEQPLSVLHAATHKLFYVGVSKVGDGPNILQKLVSSHFRSRVAKLQHHKLCDHGKMMSITPQSFQQEKEIVLYYYKETEYGTIRNESSTFSSIYLAFWALC